MVAGERTLECLGFRMGLGFREIALCIRFTIPSSASVGLTDYSQVDVMCLR